MNSQLNDQNFIETLCWCVVCHAARYNNNNKISVFPTDYYIFVRTAFCVYPSEWFIIWMMLMWTWYERKLYLCVRKCAQKKYCLVHWRHIFAQILMQTIYKCIYVFGRYEKNRLLPQTRERFTLCEFVLFLPLIEYMENLDDAVVVVVDMRLWRHSDTVVHVLNSQR